MTNHFDSSGGTQPIAQGDHPIGQQNNYGVPYEAYGALAGKLAVTEAALASFFKILEEQQVPLHDLDSKLREIAAQHKELLARVGGNQAAKQAIERGDYAKAEELLEDAACQHSMAAAETYAELASLQRIQYRHAKAATYWQKAAALLPEDKKEERALYLHNAGYDFDCVARYADALPLYEQSLAIRREIGFKAGEGVTLNNIGQIYAARGDYVAALQYLEQSLSISREVGDKEMEGATLDNIGQSYHDRGDYDKALLLYEQSLVIRREIDDKEGEGTTLNNIGQIYDAKGDYDKALLLYEQSLAISQEIGDKAGEGATMNNISQIYSARGDSTTALKYLEQSLAISREIGDKDGEAVTSWNIGLIYADQDDLKQAEAYINRAVELAEELGHRSLGKYSDGLAAILATLQVKESPY